MYNNFLNMVRSWNGQDWGVTLLFSGLIIAGFSFTLHIWLMSGFVAALATFGISILVLGSVLLVFFS
jgi:hypothetical protein